MSMVTASELRIVLAEEQAAQVEAAAAERLSACAPQLTRAHRGHERGTSPYVCVWGGRQTQIQCTQPKAACFLCDLSGRENG